MGVINVRIEDSALESLRSLAEAEGESLSEYVRGALLSRVHPVKIPDHMRGDLEAPETLRPIDRHMLSLVHRLMAVVLAEGETEHGGIDRDDHLRQVRVLEEGFTGLYYEEFSALSPELSPLDSKIVVEVLEMYRLITFSIEQLERDGVTIDPALKRSLRFAGFDGNQSLEAHMSSYVKFLTRDGRWPELLPQIEEADGGNSHAEMLPTYHRMLAEHGRIMAERKIGTSRGSYLLSIEELERLENASYWR